jgi:hypothetical protein
MKRPARVKTALGGGVKSSSSKLSFLVGNAASAIGLIQQAKYLSSRERMNGRVKPNYAQELPREVQKLSSNRALPRS